MADNINSGAFEKQPWHHKGRIKGRLMTPKEAIIDASMNWLVEIQPTYLADLSTQALAYATVRTDTGIQLGTVGNRYKVVQNHEAFDSMERLFGEGKAVINSAFALGRGERICISAKLPDPIGMNGDTLQKYIILFNGHGDGSSFGYLATLISVVCENTLNAALRGFTKEQGIKIKHQGDINLKMFDAEEFMRNVDERLTKTAERMTAWKDYEITDEQFKTLAMTLFPPPKKAIQYRDLNLVPGRTQTIWKTLMKHWKEGDGMDLPSRKNTAWGAFNSIAEFADYSRTVRVSTEAKMLGKKTGIDPDFSARTSSILFGSGAVLKQNAATLIENVVDSYESKSNIVVPVGKLDDNFFKSLSDSMG